MVKKKLRFAVVGACHVDRKARAHSPLVAATSNPVALQSCFGGVARNVAENLHRLGAEVELVTRLGSDAEGNALRSHLAGLGFSLAGVSRSAQAPTAFHLIALQPDGEMLVAVADMRIYDEITPEVLRGLPEGLWAVQGILADCNLPAETLAFLAALRGEDRRIAAVGVSPAKVCRLRPLLAACDLLCVNRGEAAALLEETAEALEPELAARQLRLAGAREVVLTLGPAGLCLAAEGEIITLPGQPGELRDVTGAGDALAAAYFEARLRGLAPSAAGRRALAAARLTLASEHSVSPELTPELLEELAS